jgi:hypothetical protein
VISATTADIPELSQPTDQLRHSRRDRSQISIKFTSQFQSINQSINQASNQEKRWKKRVFT